MEECRFVFKMPLAPGTRFGRYEISSPLGQGGMGEVYRARDMELGREVAIKVLPAALSTEADRLSRFKQEAKSLAQLNHPNILSILDAGTHDGSYYVVSELLEGETLRERLYDSSFSPRKAVELALKLAQGLAAAHEKGIIHRDLKPENIFLTRDGQVKILDFGLAKLTLPEVPDDVQPEAETILNPTTQGLIMGTVGYMSPEQAQGKVSLIDHRSDIFSFGVILYEMLAGRRAFEGESMIETLNSIIKEEPPDLSLSNREIPTALQRVVEHCMEKRPEDRFQSARDLAFNLEALSGLSRSSLIQHSPLVVGPKARQARWLWSTLGLLALVSAIALSFFLGRRSNASALPLYHQLTFLRGTIWSARFAPDGHTIVYSAAWNGSPLDVFAMRTESPVSRSLGVANARVLSVSSNGEVAVLLNPRYLYHFVSRGTLARIPLVGGAPREVLEDVQDADWSPDGTNLAVVRAVGGRNRLEYPVGKVLYETTGYVSYPRLSPRGDRIAFLDHPVDGDNRGSVAVVDLNGRKQTLSNDWSTEEGLAWSNNGEEVWFTASKTGEALALYGVTLGGKERVIARAPVSLVLHDISREGQVLLMGDSQSSPIMGLPPNEDRERDLSWLNRVRVGDLSADGKTFVFSQFGQGSGTNYALYLRRTDGSPAVELGEGYAVALSPDGKSVLSLLSTPPQLVLLPTGAGETKKLPTGGIEQYGYGANWLPDGRHVVFIGREPGRPMRSYVQDIQGGGPRAVTPEGITCRLVSPDGATLLCEDAQQNKFLYPLNGGAARPLNGLTGEDMLARWEADGRKVFVYGRGELPVKVYQFELATEHKELWKELMPPDTAGIIGPVRVFLTPDGKSYVYSFTRHLSDLYLVEGMN